ncbi:nuclear transport factor 2 family protein [Nocardia puris]|uniref:nuclear transport factor 2 family protein n=1 Tax=Nocardia puris TaxID=208602 RepID=UPI00147299F0|nr:nuclear transport factor 2 family protein [Nocardia puris]MBF6214858.1 nuclear transport factor 2 family protein [Nocardia puris]MBF6364134.1 nuclear transport factor 2 family protein [Nocardia puris]MBF6459063.1 nuclear transport factor 2 family protein [Nocardia puris]
MAGIAIGTTPWASADAQPAGRAEELTRRILDAFERKDLNAIAALLDENASITIPLSFSGAQEPAGHFAGKDEVLGYVGQVTTNFRTLRFIDLRISVAGDGETTFAQANGDFVTADGRPYRNVYIYRFDWKDGRMLHADEYANPITLCQTFDNLDC